MLFRQRKASKFRADEKIPLKRDCLVKGQTAKITSEISHINTAIVEIKTNLEKQEEKFMALLVGIDGTGSFFDSTYSKEFYNSFVNRINRNSTIGTSDKTYYRGPIAPGVLPEAINGG